MSPRAGPNRVGRPGLWLGARALLSSVLPPGLLAIWFPDVGNLLAFQQEMGCGLVGVHDCPGPATLPSAGPWEPKPWFDRRCGGRPVPLQPPCA